MSTAADDLAARLGRYPPDRYPVQYATVQFHLGCQRLHGGQYGGATSALVAARDGFALAGMELEMAKATMMLGIALRARRDLVPAADCFRQAGSALERLAQPLEHAAAAYNLGLVLADLGDADGAHHAWEQARVRFESAGQPGRASAAARDHGASLLTTGQIQRALPLLTQAYTLAEQAGDSAAMGAAANALGLARLASGEPAAAVRVLRRGRGTFARSLWPAEHAMLTANLALALEAAGQLPWARLAARQAGANPAAAAPVRAQAQEILQRHPGDPAADLLGVLDSDPTSAAEVLRDEVTRSLDLSAAERCGLIGAFLDGLLVRPGVAYDLAESFIGVILELPPRSFNLLVDAIVAASAHRGAAEVDRMQAIMGSAMARFAMPQWQRLVACLNEAAREAALPGAWR